MIKNDKSMRLLLPEKLYDCSAKLALKMEMTQSELFRRSVIEYIEKYGAKHRVKYEKK